MFIILLTIINQTSVLSSECFKVVPFGYNGIYVQLPSNFKFCVKKKNNKINYETGIYGERLLIGNKEDDYQNIFGDSHALGLDVNKIEDYFLSKIYKNNNFKIFAAPNNGPFEVLNFLKIHKDLIKDQKIIIVFNLSTDIFRINENWNPKDFVALNDFQLEKIKDRKIFYDLYFFKYLIFNRKFTIGLSNNKEMQGLFNENYIKINADFQKYLDILSDLKHDNLNLIFILPYWIYQKNNQGEFEENTQIFRKVDNLICGNNIVKTLKISDILIQKKDIDLKKEFLTIDKRHFKSNTINLTNINEFCNFK